uniref:Avidin n=1 Tax=Apteryx owenii TaxID=8824 RepID=A0A8B9PYM0_APTOW
MSHRHLLKLLALPAGVALAGVAVGSQPAETLKGEKASMKEAEGANAKSGLDRGQDQPMGRGKCNLAGWWQNELGSEMLVFNANSKGNFSGEYYTAVSSAQKPIETSPLRGSQHLDEDGKCTFGFTVNWSKFSDSTTVFVGQRFEDHRGQEVLKTGWLLRHKVNSLHDDWQATRVGTNIFTRLNCKEEGKASPTAPLSA